MKPKSRYAGAWLLAAATAVGCGSEDSAPGAIAGNGGAGAARAGGPSAAAGAPSGSNPATGGTTSSTNSEEQPNVSGGLAGGGGAGSSEMLGSAGGASPSVCVASACPALDVNADGAPEPGCCTMAGVCGGELAFMTNTFCVGADAVPAGAMPFVPEAIVPDPRCVEQTLDAPQAGGSITLPGCCDSSGICGVSTAPAAGDAGAGIPIACFTPADLAGFGMAGDAGTFPEVSCQ